MRRWATVNAPRLGGRRRDAGFEAHPLSSLVLGCPGVVDSEERIGQVGGEIEVVTDRFLHLKDRAFWYGTHAMVLACVRTQRWVSSSTSSARYRAWNRWPHCRWRRDQ